jgi:Skp family chaperone for outer membrane proteins
MKTINMLLLAAVAAIPATPAMAQAVAVADPEGAVVNTKAMTAARQQITTTYKAQLDQAEARRKAIATELQPLYTAFDAARKAPGANEASLRTQAQAIQTRQQSAEQELARITAPAQRAQAYAIEQVSAKLNDAVSAVVQRKGVTMLINPQAVMFAQQTANITPDITTELDRLVPTVSTTPPANWQPGQQQAAAGAAPAAAGATPAPAAATPARRTQGR